MSLTRVSLTRQDGIYLILKSFNGKDSNFPNNFDKKKLINKMTKKHGKQVYMRARSSFMKTEF